MPRWLDALGRQHHLRGPIAQDCTFQRCVTADAMGFGGTNCYLMNINNLAGSQPYVGP
jgi:hypothetical protein